MKILFKKEQRFLIALLIRCAQMFNKMSKMDKTGENMEIWFTTFDIFVKNMTDAISRINGIEGLEEAEQYLGISSTEE